MEGVFAFATLYLKLTKIAPTIINTAPITTLTMSPALGNS